ncbi:hypothetical protein GQ53DRAFT_740350 [Thozetella sp. PMI_491]|nr:hypothetical protein GQ53DRAFT_740350 [Thozetella sp. PMI_491]
MCTVRVISAANSPTSLGDPRPLLGRNRQSWAGLLGCFKKRAHCEAGQWPRNLRRLALAGRRIARIVPSGRGSPPPGMHHALPSNGASNAVCRHFCPLPAHSQAAKTRSAPSPPYVESGEASDCSLPPEGRKTADGNQEDRHSVSKVLSCVQPAAGKLQTHRNICQLCAVRLD